MIQTVSISFTADLSKTYLTLKSQQVLKISVVYFLALALLLLKISVVTLYSSQIGTLTGCDTCAYSTFYCSLL